MKFAVIIILLFSSAIGGCIGSISGNAIKKESIYEEGMGIEAYFCPGDSCENIILESISNAKNSVHCAFFDLDLSSLIDAIAEKSHSADVKVVIDKNNYEGQIKGQGVKVADSKQYMHNKFCILDDNLVLTGSTNPTNNDVNFNNNNIVIIYSKYIAENYEDEFNELWDGVYADGEKVKYEKINSENLIVENYFCPEDDCREKVIKTINEAMHNIYFMAFSFTDESIADAILFKNLETRGIFEALQAGSQYSQFQRLKDFGIDVIKDKNRKNMHHKVFIIDNETVITGSYNPTGSGNSVNDENLVIIRNKGIARGFVREFELLRQ
ncbi:hypothetical protein HYU09_05170 [Candidatus Woesearchaeota archaeon]|nr:hypothetical protein [Candidatus Woesearchaeota archaeon]